MNDWGVAGCKEHRQEIVTDIRSRKDQYGWSAKLGAAAAAVMTGVAWRLSITDPYGSLVDESIRRAESAPTIPAKAPGPTMPAKSPPKRLILSTDLPPGDVLTLTAAVESLHATYPNEYLTDVRTGHPAIWANNPHVTPIPDSDTTAMRIPMHYHQGPVSLGRCNEVLCPFLGAYTDHLAQVLRRPLRLTVHRPRVYLTEQERTDTPIADAQGRPTWLVCAGIKSDWTTKQWPVEYYQRVVDETADVIRWVQIGLRQHDHPELQNVVCLLDSGPPMRELLVLAYHAAGGLGPITFLQHVMAAHDRPYVAIVGGREPAAWVQYQHQHTLHTVGELDCCRTKACWKMRTVMRGDTTKITGQSKPMDSSLCVHPRMDFQRPVPECMARITPDEVIPLVRRLAGQRRAAA
jgi:ADP-heptose:LPS heptosyltransferase